MDSEFVADDFRQRESPVSCLRFGAQVTVAPTPPAPPCSRQLSGPGRPGGAFDLSEDESADLLRAVAGVSGAAGRAGDAVRFDGTS